MKTYEKYFQDKHDICIFAILIIFSALAALLAVKNIQISPDSMRFGLVSQEIISGNGIRVPFFRLEDNYVPVNGTIPFLDQMPLLPILFALLGGVTAQNFFAGQLINVISHVAISIFTFLLMEKLLDNRGIALLTGLLVSFSYPLMKVAHIISSEPFFIALTVATIYFITLSRNSDISRRGLYFLIAGICASASIMTRNAGIALVPVLFWEAFILVKNKGLKTKYGSVILAISLPIITVAVMFIRNFLISGTLRGFNQAPPERPYFDAFTGTVNMIFEQFHLGTNALALIILLTMLFVLFVAINSDMRKEAGKYLNAGLDLTIVFILSYTSLICLTMAKQQWRFELRYVSPLVPFLFISIVFMAVFVWERVKSRGFSGLSLAGVILSLAIIAFGTCYKTYLNVPYFLKKQTRVYSILQTCTYKWIKENYEKNTIIATNRPFHLSFFGGYSTVILPHKRFNPAIRLPDDMETVLPNQMSSFGSRVLVLFDNAEEKYDGSYISGLFNRRETNDKFILVHDCPDGVVYNIKE